LHEEDSMTSEEPFPKADEVTLLNAVAYSDPSSELVAGSDEVLMIHYSDGTSREHQFSFEEAQEVKKQLPER
jgi:hypothetical protein